ncbi:hypothetical protein [Teredinibacter waterburyi]|jgi:hypothetical protein|uniref:hypothetical protein n=1 Tax=Teredinibacter waterburyi TaxID=1500538 RepID=UPI00165F9E66|nr:hypothetical protein [Teredinibacter waterburyi]
MKIIPFFGLVAAFVLVSICEQSFAHSANDSADTGMLPLVHDSSAIVFGKVIDIEYKNSEPSKEEPTGLPHTFVTYQIEKAFRGKLREERLTLRFPGGADGAGGYYMDTNTPTFSRGETDVLFVLGGEVEGCPLVDCVEGRFRIYEDQVYNAWGVPVVEVLKELKIGGKPRFDLNVMEIPRPSFEQIMQREDFKEIIESDKSASGMTLKEMREVYEKEAPEFYHISYGVEGEVATPDESKDGEVTPMEIFGKPLTVDAFFAALEELAKEAEEPRLEVLSASSAKDFYIAPPTVEKLEDSEEKAAAYTTKATLTVADGK